MITLIVILILLGVVLQFIKPHVDGTLYRAAIIIIVIAVFLILLSWLGVADIPRIR